MVLKVLPILILIEVLLAIMIFFSSLMLYRIWKKLRTKDLLMLALPCFLLLALTVRFAHGLIWIV